MSLRIERLGPADTQARVTDVLAPDGHTSWHTDGTERWLHRVRRTPDRYVVDRLSVGEQGAEHLVDRTVFHLGGGQFIEAERYLEHGGPNVHRHPIVLPDGLTVGTWQRVTGGAAVVLLYAGPIALVAGNRRVEARGLALVGEEGGHREVQWLVQGRGVVWLGPLGGKPRRWLCDPAT